MDPVLAGFTLVVMVSPPLSATPVNDAPSPVVVALLNALQLDAVKADACGAAAAGVTEEASSTRPIAVPMALILFVVVRMVGTSSQWGGAVGALLAARGATHNICIRSSLHSHA